MTATEWVMPPEETQTKGDERLIDVPVGQVILSLSLSRKRNLGQQLFHLVTKVNSLCIACFVAKKLKVSCQRFGRCLLTTGLCAECFCTLVMLMETSMLHQCFCSGHGIRSQLITCSCHRAFHLYSPLQ